MKGKRITIGQDLTIAEIQKIAIETNGKPLTAKQAKVIKVYSETGNKSEAGRQAYPDNKTEQSKAVQARQTLQNPLIKPVIVQVMEKSGITDEYLTRRLKNGIEKGKNEGFDHLKLAFELKSHLQKTNINLSHSVKELRKTYSLDK